MALGKRIKSRRLELGMTQAELAKKAGVTEATINRYESGEIKNPRQPVLAKLIDALRVEPNYLMGWTDYAPEPAFIDPERRYLLDQLHTMSDDQVKQLSAHTDWLFATSTGLPSMTAVHSALARILQHSAVWQGQLMITPALSLSLYDFRHTFATTAADSGMPMHLLQRLLGHADAQTTMRYYVHATSATMDQMAAHMSDFGSNLGAIDRQTTADTDHSRQIDA